MLMHLKRYIKVLLLCLCFIGLSGCTDRENEVSENTNIETSNETDSKESENIENDDINKIQDVKLQYTSDYSEDLAWITYTDVNSNEAHYGCVDKNGKLLFYINYDRDRIDSDRIIALLPFSNGYSYIKTINTLSIVDNTGIIMKTYSMEEDETNKVFAYADGNVWIEQYVSGFDEAYYEYTLYDPNGNTLTEFKYDGTDPIYEMYYYGKGVWGYDVQGDNNEYFQRFYCINSNKWVDSATAYGNHNIYFYEDEAVIGVRNDDGYSIDIKPGTLCLMNYNGDLSEIPEPENVSIWGGIFISGDYCVLKDGSDLTSCNISTEKFIKMENEYTEKVNMDSFYGLLMFRNGKIVLPLIGNDGENYVGIFDTSWNIIGDPIKSEKYRNSEERLLVIEDVDERNITVYDNNGQRVFSPNDMGYVAMTSYKNGVARVLSSDAMESAKTMASQYMNLFDFSDVYGSSEKVDTFIQFDGWNYIDMDGNLLFDTIDVSSSIEIEL